jgi:hypothetical protein
MNDVVTIISMNDVLNVVTYCLLLYIFSPLTQVALNDHDRLKSPIRALKSEIPLAES